MKPGRLLLRVKQARIVLRPEVGARHSHRRLDLIYRSQRPLGLHIEWGHYPDRLAELKMVLVTRRLGMPDQRIDIAQRGAYA
ncbi:MAG: hypothetical protein P8L39_10175 [Halioglobus sp.]|nr:hypothetical protein [Halioglobus sp.]